MKNLLTSLFLICAIIAYSQPPNDSCFQAINVPLVNGYGTFLGTTADATASNPLVVSNPNSPTFDCLSTLSAVEDVWFEFTTGSIFPKYKITIVGNSPSDNPAFGVTLGYCTPSVQGIFYVGCVNNHPQSIYEQIEEIDLINLIPNTQYFSSPKTQYPIL